jgi:hypothetical protein
MKCARISRSVEIPAVKKHTDVEGEVRRVGYHRCAVVVAVQE